MQALAALKRPTTHWDDLLIYILSSKLDELTLREWQSSLTTTNLPSFRQFLEFLSHRCEVLEASGKGDAASSKTITTRSKLNAKRQSTCVATVSTKCVFCRGEYLIYYCKSFLALTIPQRISEIKKRKICINCIRSNSHQADSCISGNCKICNSKHNTLLHAATGASDASHSNTNKREEVSSTNFSAAIVTHTTSSFNNKDVLLSTAVVHAYDVSGKSNSCRILLDCGSQANFISRGYLDRLRLKPKYSNVSINGINNTATQATQTVQVRLQSRINSFSRTIDCIVSEQVTVELPTCHLKRNIFDIPRNLKLAYPRFNEPSEINILIGADLFWESLCIGQVKPSREHPLLQKTRFGWILAGRFGNASFKTNCVQLCHASISNAQLHEQLARFWHQEELPEASHALTLEESCCEDHFLKNVSRTAKGRFVVKLPMDEKVTKRLGDSKNIAMKRLYGIEKRFKRDNSLKEQYSRFMNEYRSLNHMRLVDESADNDSLNLYLPHHCVFKSDAGSSKIRVVFDASCKTSTGVSLNDALLVGPVIQQNLMSILMRLRTHHYVIVGDIIKMYRQIFLHTSQTRYHRILWRDNPEAPVNTYELTTLTYGTSSASYLATRCLKHLAESHRSELPLGSRTVERDFYMDDMLSGADSLDEVAVIRDETISLLRSGGFELSKWASNHPDLIKDLSGLDSSSVTIDKGKTSSVLGVKWNATRDTFCFLYEPPEISGTISKRVILSEVSRLFDPLGLLGPIIVSAKLVLQDLWRSGTSWDESVPPDIYFRWIELKAQLVAIYRLRVPRCVKFATDLAAIQIHGFCDASQ